jgi:hypothetical protein
VARVAYQRRKCVVREQRQRDAAGNAREARVAAAATSPRCWMRSAAMVSARR